VPIERIAGSITSVPHQILELRQCFFIPGSPAFRSRGYRDQLLSFQLEGEEIERTDASNDGLIDLDFPDHGFEDLKRLQIEQILHLHGDQDLPRGLGGAVFFNVLDHLVLPMYKRFFHGSCIPMMTHNPRPAKYPLLQFRRAGL
jgi:hypothetical protein